MKVYNVKAVANFWGITERRVRQLKTEGFIREYKKGLYRLDEATQQYIRFLQKGGTDASVIDYQAEKAKLIKAKRENEEIELAKKRQEVHSSDEIEQALKDILINFKTRIMAIPAKLSPVLAKKTDKAEIFALIKDETDKALEELSDFNSISKNVGEEDAKAD